MAGPSVGPSACPTDPLTASARRKRGSLETPALLALELPVDCNLASLSSLGLSKSKV